MKLLADDPKIYATEMKTTFGADVFQYALDSLGCGLAVTVLCNADWQSASGQDLFPKWTGLALFHHK